MITDLVHALCSTSLLQHNALQGASAATVEETALEWAGRQPQLSPQELRAGRAAADAWAADIVRGRSAKGSGTRNNTLASGVALKLDSCASNRAAEALLHVDVSSRYHLQDVDEAIIMGTHACVAARPADEAAFQFKSALLMPGL